MIRSDVWGRLDDNASSIIEMWCDVELAESRKTIGDRFSASMSEVGEFLQLMLGPRKYDEVIKEKRIIFIRKVVAERAIKTKEKKEEEILLRQKIVLHTLPVRVRMMSDFHEEELASIHERLLTRITPQSKWTKKRKRRLINFDDEE